MNGLTKVDPPVVEGRGGVQPQNMKFLSFAICCSPSFGVSKMGSFVSQLQAVVEIWRDEVDPFARFFANLYR